MYILLYILIVLLQYQLIRNTQKNWFNQFKYLKWSESETKATLPFVIITSLLPLVGLIPLLVYEFEYWTFRNIKILNP